LRPPALLVVCLAVFVDMLGFGIILPLLPFHVEHLGGSGFWVGALLTAYSAAQFFSSPVLGSLSDRYGRRRLLLASLAGSAISMGLAGMATNLISLLLARTVAGACGGSIAVAQAYVVDLSGPKNRIRALGAVGASIGLGFVVGPAIGAILAAAGVGFAGACYLAAAVAAVNVVLGLFLLPPGAPAAVPVSPAGAGGDLHDGAEQASTEVATDDEGEDASARRRLSSLWTAVQRTQLRPVLFAIFATTFAFAGLETTFAYLGAARFELGAAGLGVAFASVGAVLIIVQGVLVGPVADRYGDRPVAVGGAVLLAISLMLVPYAPPVLTFIALGLVAAGQGLLTTTTAALIARVAHGGRAKLGGALGIGQSAAAAARVLGPVIGGLAYDIALPLPYVLGTLLCGAAAILLSAVPDEAAVADSRRSASRAHD
jgi:DHA1 family tetracycline resistance protein-like MFS transporter